MSPDDFIKAGDLGRHGWARTTGIGALVVGGGIAGNLLVRIVLLPTVKTVFKHPSELIRSSVLAVRVAVMPGGALAVLFVGTRWLHQRSVHTLVTAAPSAGASLRSACWRAPA